MMARVSEVIRGWLGWCPNTGMAKVKTSINHESGFSSAKTVAGSPGTAGADSSKKPWEGMYEHTQRGTVIIGAVTSAIILILVSMYVFGAVWVTIFVLCLLVFLLAIASSLTAAVRDDALKIRFGPVGLIRKSWPLAEIDTVTPVTNPWYYGWGVRWTPWGILYNVAGFRAVEVRLFSGKKFRIGTDEPEKLCHALRQACVSIGPGSASK